MNNYINNMFDSEIARRGGTVRRKRINVLKYASPAELKQAIRERGHHLLEYKDQYLIFCDNASNFKIVC